MVDLSGGAYAMLASKKENKKFQYMFEQVCIPYMKMPESQMSPTQKNSYMNCIRLASVDPILFPILKQYDVVSNTLGIAGYDFGLVIGAFEKIRDKLRCTNATSLPVLDSSIFYSEDDPDSGYMDPGISKATVQYALQDLSPYYLAPDILDFITKYLLGSTEVDEANATINTYLDSTDQNRALTYGIILKMIAPPANKK